MAQPDEERRGNNLTNIGIVNANRSPWQFEESFDDGKHTSAHLHQHPSADAGVFNEREGAGRLLASLKVQEDAFPPLKKKASQFAGKTPRKNSHWEEEIRIQQDIETARNTTAAVQCLVIVYIFYSKICRGCKREVFLCEAHTKALEQSQD